MPTFSASAAWNNRSHDTSIKGRTSARAAADLRVLDNGVAQVRLEVEAVSYNFKVFSAPAAVVILADHRGEFLETIEVSALAMSMGSHAKGNIRRTRRDIDATRTCRAAYAFFRLRHCSYRQGFDRTNKESSEGCIKIARGPFAGDLEPFLDREKEELAQHLPDRVASLRVEIGETFELLGWQAERLR